MEAGAVGLARGDGQETGAGTGDLAVAVVSRALALLNEASHGGGDEGQDDGGLHVDGWTSWIGWRLGGILKCRKSVEDQKREDGARREQSSVDI